MSLEEFRELQSSSSVTENHFLGDSSQGAFARSRLEESDTTSPHRTVITAPSGWRLFNLAELWRYRELLYFLAWRDIKVRYKQTVMGLMWTIIQPVIMMTVFTIVFGKAIGLDEKIPYVPYPIFALSGLICWNLFSGAISGSSNSVLGSASILTKIYFPRLFIPVAAVGVNVVNFVVSLAVLLVIMGGFAIAGSDITIGLRIVLLPIVAFLILASALAFGIGVSAVMVIYRDVRHLAPFLIQNMIFLTPVVYPVSIFPAQYRWILALNPMTGLTGAFRFCLFGGPFQWGDVAIGLVVTGVLLFASCWIFNRAEATFADIV